MTDLDWGLHAECRKYPADDWFPESGSGARAKDICISYCPVRRECGTDAVKRDERYAIAAGFRLTDAEQRIELREWLGLPVKRSKAVACTQCGREFETRKRATLCPECRDNVDAEPVRRHLIALSNANVSLREIALEALVSPSMVRGLLCGSGGNPWQTIARDRAERIMAIPIPRRAVS